MRWRTGEYMFWVKASNVGGDTTKLLTLRIFNPDKPKFDASALPEGAVNYPYDFTLNITGSPVISVTCSNLTEGLSMDSTGRISGIPTATGTYELDVTAENTGGSAKAILTLKVKKASFKISTKKLSKASYAKKYNAKISTSGLKVNDWSITSGILPAGLSLDAGRISGIPEEIGAFIFTVRAGNGAVYAEKELTLNVKAIDSKIKTTSLKTAIKGSPYSVKLKAAGTAF